MMDRAFHVGCAAHLADELSGQVSFLEINLKIVGSHAVSDRCYPNLGIMSRCGSLHKLTAPIHVIPELAYSNGSK